jgi:hypothetical protein
MAFAVCVVIAAWQLGQFRAMVAGWLGPRVVA